MNNATHTTARRIFGAALAAAVAVPLAFAGMASAQDYPSADETLDWTIAFGPGGGNDIMARSIVEILNKYELYPGDIRVENRAGGSGAVGWGYLASQAGNPYGISTTSGSFVTTPLQADTGWAPEDFTPVALLATDDLVLVVNGSSEIQNIEEFIAYAKENPINIGGTGTVNVDFIVPTLFAQAAGFEFDYVSFNDMSEQTTALLSNALDAMVGNPGEILGTHRVRRPASARVLGPEHPRRSRRRADHGRHRLRHRRVDAARPDPGARRPGRGAGMVDRDHEEGRRYSGMERIYRLEHPHADGDLWRGFPDVPDQHQERL